VCSSKKEKPLKYPPFDGTAAALLVEPNTGLVVANLNTSVVPTALRASTYL
jgi:hypothetical protein